jgi:hypothetical protein
MILELTKRIYTKVEVGFEYPFFRHKGVNEDESIYYKFESESKITIIHEKMVSTEITTYDDDRVSRDILTEDMVNGFQEFSVISEKAFSLAEDRLISKIQRG